MKKKNTQRKTLYLAKETIASLTGSSTFPIVIDTISPEDPESTLSACMTTSINTSG